jgi:hypothetical protein
MTADSLQLCGQHMGIIKRKVTVELGNAVAFDVKQVKTWIYEYCITLELTAFLESG